MVPQILFPETVRHPAAGVFCRNGLCVFPILSQNFRKKRLFYFLIKVTIFFTVLSRTFSSEQPFLFLTEIQRLLILLSDIALNAKALAALPTAVQYSANVN